MRESIPLSFIRIWCRKNELTVNLKLTSGDQYQVDETGYYILLRDGTRAEVNPRHIFTVIDHYPSLRIEDIAGRTGNVQQGFIYGQKPDAKIQPRRETFDAVYDEVQSYLSTISQLEPSQFYVALRAYEAGLINLPNIMAVVGKLRQNQTFGAALIQQNFCTWETLLSACLDIEKPHDPHNQDTRARAIPSFELSGEILLALGKITRTQLETATRSKRGGDKPLGELLVEMGACTKKDIEACLVAQSQMTVSLGSPDNGSFLGDLLIRNGKVSADALAEALRIQHIGRQPLHAVLVSMGICTKEHVAAYKANRGTELSDRDFGDYLLERDIAHPRQLEEAVRIQQRGRQLLGELLISLNLCSREEINKALAAQQEFRASTKKALAEKQKLGDLLIRRQLVEPKNVEEAAKIQTFSRQKMGTTLISLGACSQKDFNEALEVQFNWREQSKQTNDKLGQELVQAGRISPMDLTKALELHGKAGRPLGEILVQYGVCTPETVIVSMITRDERRRAAFAEFLDRLIEKEDDKVPVKAGFVDKISSWIKKK